MKTMKRMLALLLAGLMVLGTCSGYAAVPDPEILPDTEEESDTLPETDEILPVGDAAPGTIGMMNPYLDGQSMTIYKNESDIGHKQPQIIYGTFQVNGQNVTRSLYCIDFAKSLRSGTGFAEKADYRRLNKNQKNAISYVLGKTKILDAPRNAEGGFDNTGNLVGWQEYVATQLLIWYYIDKYYTPGTCEGIGWYGVERACADGYANLEYCTMVRNYIDSIYTIPSFAAERKEQAPTYELKYNPASGLYETTLTDTNGVLDRFEFQSSNGVTYTRSGNTLKITSTEEITKGSNIAASGSYRADIADLTYVTSINDSEQPTVKCENASRRDPVNAYFNLTTENYTASIRVNKSSELPAINNDKTTMVGAVYGVYTSKVAAEAAKTNYKTSADAQTGAKKEGATGVVVIKKNSDGSVNGKINNLPIGVYYVKEVYAPNGWTLDATVYKADASERNTSTHVTTVTIVSKETPVYGQIYVGKVKKTNPFEESGFDIGSDTDMTMAGAEYGVFKTKADAQAAQIKNYNDSSAYSDNRVATIVTDKTDTTSALGGGPDLSGFSVYGISKELPRGTYYIVETKAPQGWLRDRTIYQKATSKKADSGVYYGLVSSQETEQSAAIEVYKTDATGTTRIADATLKGAKYGVYKTGRPGPTPTYERIENATIITDKTGYGYIEGVPVGIYYVKEEEPAPGYKLDPNWYPVEVTPDMVAGVTPAPKVESKETPILTDYEITKVTVEGNSGATNPTPLAGCTFSLYLKSDLDSNKLTYKDGKLALALSYDDSGNVITTGTALAGVKPYYTATTGADGKALFENCYKGNYIVIETKVGRRADGVRYRAIDPYEISLPIASGSSYKTKEAVTLTDEMIGSNIRIMKVDTKTGAKITGTAAFKIYNLNTNTYIKMSVNGSLTDRFTTDKNGYITFDNRLPYGHYRLEEVEASNWYCLANLEINVADGYVEYRELDEDNQPGPWTKCYTAEENGVTFNIVRVGDTPHYVRVEKVDEDGKRLIGATLAIVHADTENQSPRRNADGSYDILQIAKMDNDKPVLKADGTFEMTDAIWKSEENLTVWAYVPEGDYYLVELEAPAGYVTAEPLAFHVSNNVKDITINGEQKRVDERDQTLTMMDRKLSVKISKQDITTGKELPGAILEVKNEKGELIERWTSTDQPHYLENITPGKYILTEILAPEGYSKAQSIEFVIKDSVADQKVVMKDELTHIEFLKVDENGQALAGATLEIHDLEGNVLESWESATEPHTVRGLAAGTYVLHEAAAPEGLLLADDIEFTVTDKPQVIKVTMTDKMIRGNFKLIKTSKQITGKRLQGATFSLYRSNPEGDEFLGLYVTDENGEINIYNLPYGDYYLKEERANARYYLNAETCRFEIRNNGETVIKNYENEAIAGRIIVHYEGTKDRGQSVVAHPQTGDAMRLRLNMILLCGITAGFLGFLCMRPVVRKRRKK
ncbi:MAG: Cys-Gln thioester bond-forming surface protein [Clostridium sp.]|nr:Cys-Gln thioester bond-forming surface protein [Clostridium sp.]